MRLDRVGRGVAALGAGLALLVGCASAVPTPVKSIEPLVGKWSGTVVVSRGPQQPFYLTVNPDQTIVATWDVNWSWGKITIEGGQASFEMNPPPLEGTFRYYAGSGRPTLFMDDLWGQFSATVGRTQ